MLTDQTEKWVEWTRKFSEGFSSFFLIFSMRFPRALWKIIKNKIEKKMKKTLCVYINPFLGANTEPKNGDWKQFEEGFSSFHSGWSFNFPLKMKLSKKTKKPNLIQLVSANRYPSLFLTFIYKALDSRSSYLCCWPH